MSPAPLSLLPAHTAPARSTHGTSDAQPAAQAYKRWFKEIREAYLVRCLSLSRLSLPFSWLSTPVASRCPALSLPPLTGHLSLSPPLQACRVGLSLSLPLTVPLSVVTSTSNVACVAVSHCSPLTLSLPISCCRSIHCRVATFIHCVSCCTVGRPSQHGTQQARSPCQGRSCCTTALLPYCCLSCCCHPLSSWCGLGNLVPSDLVT